jgi:hypothetical protein
MLFDDDVLSSNFSWLLFNIGNSHFDFSFLTCEAGDSIKPRASGAGLYAVARLSRAENSFQNENCWQFAFAFMTLRLAF